MMASLLLIASISLPGCSDSDNSDAEALLSTVPSSVSAVAVISPEAILEKAGCRSEGGKVAIPQEVKTLVDGISDAKTRSAVETVVSGESGVDPACAVFFSDIYNSYLTAMVADTGRFRSFAESTTGRRFSKAGDIDVCGNIAIKGAQMWVCLSSDSTIDAKATANFTTLGKSRSFMSNKATELMTGRHDISVWSDANAVARTSSGAGFPSGGSYGPMALSTAFADATAYLATIDFDNGGLRVKGNVLNSDGGYAKYLLPTGKIDTSVAEKIGGDVQALMAIDLSAALIKKLQGVASMVGQQGYADMLSPIDGTAAIGLSDAQNPGQGLRAVITTKDGANQALLGILGLAGQTKTDGKYVMLTAGAGSGKGMPVKEAASKLKGSTFGIVVAGEAFKSVELPVSLLTARLMKEHDSLELDLVVKSDNPKENAAITLLRFFNKASGQSTPAAAKPTQPAEAAPATPAAPAEKNGTLK